MDNYKSLMIGEKAPSFSANTTYGTKTFPDDYKGKWLIFFSHPNDFTPVCSTEIMTFASMQDDFKKANCELLGISVDGNPSHIEWCRALSRYQWKNIKNPNIGFPIVADEMGKIARMYGMLMPAASETKTVRTVFFIDPKGIIRAMLSYPLTTGRNMKEIMRLLLALQEYDKFGNPTPADWQPGDPTIMSPPQTLPASFERGAGSTKGNYNCLDWYLCFTDNKAMKEPIRMAGEMQMTEAPCEEEMSVAPSMPKMETAPVMETMPVKEVVEEKAPIQAPTENMRAKMADMPMTMRNTMPVTSPKMNPMKNSMMKSTAPKTVQRPKNYSNGIMEQNQLLFSSNLTENVGTDYIMTRDFPNMGE